jgi:beta-lactamase class A
MKSLLFAIVFIAFGQLGAQPMQQLRTDLQQFLDQQSGDIAVSIFANDGKDYLGINDEVVFHAASTMKVPVMAEVFRQAQAGKFSLDDSLRIKNSFRSIVDSSEYAMDITEDSGDRLYSRIGMNESIRDLVIEMITRSGNLATNLLIDLVDPANVRELMAGIDAADMNVLRGVEDIKAYRAGLSNTTTAKGFARILEAIRADRIVTPDACREMREILFAQEFNDKIPAGLPKTAQVAHKTGEITRISHDGGIIYPANGTPFVLVVLTRGYDESAAAKKVIARVAEIVYHGISGSR